MASLKALEAQVVALQHIVSAALEKPAPKPPGAPCGHVDAVKIATREGEEWVCGDCPG
jgi:hypothetical protein